MKFSVRIAVIGASLLIAIIVLAANSSPTLKRSRTNDLPNILLILCDTLRSDHVGAYGYHRPTTPEIDAFAKGSLRFDNAVSAAPWTPPSIASIFTGAIPSVHGLNPPNDRTLAQRKMMRLSDKFTTLAERLKEIGYTTRGISASPWSSDVFGLQQGFDSTWQTLRVSGDVINRQAFEDLEKLKKSGRPFFLYLHYMDVHKRGDNPSAPYDEFPQIQYERWNYKKRAIEQLALYDAELKFFDTQFGGLMRKLQSEGLYDDSLIVFTSDHGEQFGERGKIGHGFSLHSEELKVPLIVKAPRGGNGIVEDLVSNRDIFATVMSVVGEAPPDEIFGTSLLSTNDIKTRRGLISEATRKKNMKSLSVPSHNRLILEYAANDPSDLIPNLALGKVLKVINKSRDPLENDIRMSTNEIEKLKELFESEYHTSIQSKIEAEHTTMSKETMNNLRSLGYLGGK